MRSCRLGGNALALLISAFSSITAGAASFDCAKASTRIESAICDSPQISTLDEELSVAYRGALAASTDPDAVKTGQRAWVKQTRDQCKDDACLVVVYQQRISSFGKGVLAEAAPGKQLTGGSESAISGEKEIEPNTIVTKEAVTSAPTSATNVVAESQGAQIITEKPVITTSSAQLYKAEKVLEDRGPATNHESMQIAIAMGVATCLFALIVWIVRRRIHSTVKIDSLRQLALGANSGAKSSALFKSSISVEDEFPRDASAPKSKLVTAAKVLRAEFSQINQARREAFEQGLGDDSKVTKERRNEIIEEFLSKLSGRQRALLKIIVIATLGIAYFFAKLIVTTVAALCAILVVRAMVKKNIAIGRGVFSLFVLFLVACYALSWEDSSLVTSCREAYWSKNYSDSVDINWVENITRSGRDEDGTRFAIIAVEKKLKFASEAIGDNERKWQRSLELRYNPDRYWRCNFDGSKVKDIYSISVDAVNAFDREKK